jgi:hypothetical protein
MSRHTEADYMQLQSRNDVQAKTIMELASPLAQKSADERDAIWLMRMHSLFEIMLEDSEYWRTRCIKLYRERASLGG